MADELKILSAGAVKPALTKITEAFQRDNGIAVQVAFATAPAILQQLGSGAQADAVIVPEEVLAQLTRSGQCAVAETTTVGKVGVGILVRNGQPLPRISTVDEFKQSLLAAESLVYNQASTGIYLEKLFASLGVAEVVKSKTTRYPDFAAVLDRVSKGTGAEIGFGATTVIVENQNYGVSFAGPLSPEIQNYTTYCAAALVQANQENARRFVRYLATPAARSLFAAAGLE
jgi:molybdate transport system substrate-binding protein